jgi:hypothetical protein
LKNVIEALIFLVNDIIVVAAAAVIVIVAVAMAMTMFRRTSIEFIMGV